MTTNDAATRYRQDELLRFPRKAAVISAIVAVIGAAVQSFALDTISAPLIGLAIVSAVISLAALSNMIGIPRRAIDRIQRLADEEGGRYSEWKDGTGGHTGIVFAYGARHERFGVLEYVDKGIAVEIGHVASEVSERFRAPAGRRHSYVAMRLPQRMPHMLVDFGVLGRVLGLRIAPGQWHRSQRLALGAWRDLPLYVADGGEAIARKFFTPELVALLKRIGRFYDVEIRGDELYLFSRRSVAYGSDARWAMQRELIDELIDQLAESDVWESVRSDAHAASFNDLRADVTRGVVIVFSVAAVVVVILSVVIVNATGVLD